MTKTLARIAAAVGLAGALLTGCGDDEGESRAEPGPEAIASRLASCEGRLGPAIDQQPPKALPRPDGATFDGRTPAASEVTWTGYVAGDDPIAMRDELAEAFRDAKFKISGVQARGDEQSVGTFGFEGPRSGFVLTAQLCDGQIRLGYTLRTSK